MIHNYLFLSFPFLFFFFLNNSLAFLRDYDQGHPMDLFLKIFVLQANFCWLGDLGNIIYPLKESVAGK